MKRDKTKKMTPRLRFPEFRDKGEWEEKTLNDICMINPSCEKLPEIFYYIDLECVVSGKLSNKSEIYRKNAPSRAQRLLKEGDVIYQTVRPYQRNNFFCIFEDGNDYVASTGYAQLRANGCNKFLFQIIHTDDFVNKAIEKCTGSSYPAINSSDLGKIRVTIPCLSEQQKIASCLSSLDDLITAQSQKLETLKAHKKGLMQQLFPAEGETVPKLRFPEFNGEWDRIELGRFIEIKGRIGYRGYTVNDIVKEGEGAISLSPSNINDAGNLSFEKSTYISWEKYEESPEIMLEDGFTILVKTGSSYGKSALVRNLPVKTTINPQLVVLKPVRINGFFLFLIISNSLVQKQINETVVGGAIPTLSQESISKFEVLIPNEIEQQKIASCLSSLDDLIATQSQKLETLKLHKKGLMQGLFPVGEE